MRISIVLRILCGSRLSVVCIVTFVVTWCPRFVICITKNLLRPEVKTVRNPVCLSSGRLLPLESLSICRPNVS